MSTVAAPTETARVTTTPGTIADLPGPRGLPLLGNAHQLRDITTLHQQLEAWAQVHGPIYRVDVGRSRSLVVVSDLEEINAILRDRPEGIRRWSRQQEMMKEMVPKSDGVFFVEGADWKRQRRLVISALNTNHLQRYFETIRTSGLRLHRRLTDAANGNRSLVISDELASYTVDITASLVFGHDLNTLEEGKNELEHHVELMMQALTTRMFAPVPYWRWVKTPAQRQLEAALAGLQEAIDGFIAQARARMEARPELLDAPENLLDAMLAAQRTEGKFTDEEIAGNVLVLLVAGQDTTAHTLSWTLWLLSTRPELQQKLAEEARAALGDEPFPSDHEMVDRLPYAEAVLKESMRLHSVAPVGAFETLVDRTICGTAIPAGTELNLLLRAATLEHGDDTDVFRPERWIEDEEKPERTLGFGAGPRFCPGRNLALIEVKSALAMLARDFEIRLDPAAPPVREVLNFTLMPSEVRLQLSPRAPAA